MPKFVCPDCGNTLVVGRDIHGRCFVCSNCGMESCDLTDIEVVNEKEREEKE